jgi:nucleoside-diphosphate kinase
MEKAKMEQTLVLIKPDALKNSLTGFILSQLSEYHTGLLMAATKIVHVNKMLASEHYYEHKSKSFFSELVDYICGIQHFKREPSKQRVKAFVYQGPDAIKKVREIAGPTDPHVARETKPGCIRALGTVIPILDENGKKIGMIIDNLIHASANENDAEREIKLWFKPADMPPVNRAFDAIVSKEHFYYKEDKLFANYVEGSYCLVAPGDLVWKTDLEALQLIIAGKPSDVSLATVATKYLINME